MFEEDPDRETIVADIIQYLGSHAMTLSHSRHLHMPDLMDLGLKIESLEADQEFQDKVLSVHHSAVISIAQTKAVKIIENNIGKAYIQTAQKKPPDMDLSHLSGGFLFTAPRHGRQ